MTHLTKRAPHRVAHLIATAIAVTLMAHAPTASSQSSPSPAAAVVPLSESLTGDAKRDYDSAKILYGDGDFGGALVKFRRSYDESKDPRLLWNQAACEKNLRHYAKVVGLVRRVLAEGGPLLSESAKADANDLMRALEPLTANVQLTVHPEGATVYIDGELVGVTPLGEAPLVDLGTRQLRVTKEGYKESVTSLAIGGSGPVATEVSLGRDVHEGTFVVQAGHGDGIAIDGRVLALEHWQGVLPSGAHELRVTAAGKRPLQTEFVVQDNQVKTLEVSLENEARPAGIPTWAWIAGGVVLVGAAAVTTLVLYKPTDQATGPSVVGSIPPGTVQLSLHRR